MATEGDCPEWLNKDYLESAIRAGENDESLQVISSEVASMAAPGNQFMSRMYRASVGIERQSEIDEVRLVIKVVPEKQELLQMAEDGNIFELELRLLKDISPKMHELLQRVPPGDFQQFTPKFYHFHDNPAAIVMEDLKNKGFETVDRKLGLDYEHSLLVMKTLARYHACSVILNNNNPELIEIFKAKDPDLAFRSIIEAGSVSGFKEIMKEIASWPGYEIYVDKIDEMIKDCADKWYAARSREDDDFNVLIHGDLWLTNIMFKHSEVNGDVEDIRFIDFQFSYWTSPVVDLLYFLNSSTELGIMDKHDALIEEYHKTLTNTLSCYGLIPPSLDELKTKIQKKCVIGLQTAIGFRSIVMADENQVQELTTDLKNLNRFSENYKEALRVLLPVLDARGWF